MRESEIFAIHRNRRGGTCASACGGGGEGAAGAPGEVPGSLQRAAVVRNVSTPGQREGKSKRATLAIVIAVCGKAAVGRTMRRAGGVR